MTTNLHYPEPPQQGSSNSTGIPYPAYEVAQGQILMTPAPISVQPFYDESPGEPAEYVVPAEYRRPYGEAPRDKRGKFWLPAYASLTSGIAGFVILSTGLSIYLAHLVAALASIILGIRALRLMSKSPATSFKPQAKKYAWIGISLGIVLILLTIVGIIALVALMNYLDDMGCAGLLTGDATPWTCNL